MRRLRAMSRLVLPLLCALLLSACLPGGGGSGDEADPDRDTRAFQAEMDALAEDVLPDLHAAVGGQLAAMPTRFYEKGGGLGVWQYTAHGQFVGAQGSPEQAVSAARSVLEEHGMSVRATEHGLHATSGNVYLGLDATTVAATSQVLVSVEMGATEGLTSDDDYAEGAPTPDYASFLS